MANSYFRFKQFEIQQKQTAMKVTTDACLFGAWASRMEQSHVGFKQILDIGAGTGLLSLMLAQQNQASIDAVEIDALAANEAKNNIEASPWPSQIRLLQGNILHNDLPISNSYDVVISNPPFYENDLRSPQAGKRIAHHADELPMAELLGRIYQLLKNDGRFYLLFPARREAELIESLATAQLGITEICRVRPSQQLPVFRIMVTGGHSNSISKQKAETELTIRVKENTYSDSFIDLLQPFYLYL